MPPTKQAPESNIRIRTGDDFQPSLPKARRNKCRKTIKIGETIYRCNLDHSTDLTEHKESGIIKGGKRSENISYYEVTWADGTRKVIREP